MTSAVRYKNGSTGQNLTAIVDILNHGNVSRVILFASPREETEDYSRSDEPSTNLPLVAALAEFEIPHVGTIHVVFDGLFLTAARSPRYGEVKALLDTAIASGKAAFSKSRAGFTSSLPPAEAAERLLGLGPFVNLDAATRPDYFALLSSISEASISKL